VCSLAHSQSSSGPVRAGSCCLPLCRVHSRACNPFNLLRRNLLAELYAAAICCQSAWLFCAVMQHSFTWSLVPLGCCKPLLNLQLWFQTQGYGVACVRSCLAAALLVWTGICCNRVVVVLILQGEFRVASRGMGWSCKTAVRVWYCVSAHPCAVHAWAVDVFGLGWFEFEACYLLRCTHRVVSSTLLGIYVGRRLHTSLQGPPCGCCVRLLPFTTTFLGLMVACICAASITHRSTGCL
jgi:hypothetical protein